MTTRHKTWIVASDDDWRNGIGERTDIHNARILSTSFLLQRELARNECSVELWADHFPTGNSDDLYSTAIGYAGHWHNMIDRPEFASQLEFQGIDLTSLMDYAVCYLFSDLIHNIEIIERLFAVETPSSVIVGDPRYITSQLLRDACAERNVEFRAGPKNPCHNEKQAHKHTPNPIKVCRAAWRFRQDLRSFRSAERPVRVLARRARYTTPIAEANKERLACLFYDGKQMAGFLRLKALFNNDLRRAIRRATQKCRQLKRLYRDLGKPALDYKGYNLWPYLRKYLNILFGNRENDHTVLCDKRFASKVWRPLPELLDNVLYAQLYLKTAQPDAVIVEQDNYGLGRAFVECARAADVPTIVLQHGIPAVYYPIRATQMFMWGSYGVSFFCDRYGEKREKTAITGNPELDSIEDYTQVKTPPDEVREQFRISNAEKVILFIGQPHVGLTPGDSPVYWEKQTHAIIEAAAGIQNCRLILRPHPAESAGAYEAVIRRLGAQNCILSRQNDLLSLVNACDLTVTWNSTVSLDVLLLGGKLLILDLYGYDTGIPFRELGGIPVVRHAKNLAKAIETALAAEPDIEQRRRFISEQLYPTDIPPTQLSYEKLRELIREIR